MAEKGWYQSLTGRATPLPARIHDQMLDLLSASVASGTGHQAALSVDTFGKTGTTQDNRDALFMGFANGVVTGVWVGNDDNSPNPGLSGGGVPARIWRDFMTDALNIAPVARPAPVEEVVPEDMGDAVGDLIGNAVDPMTDQLRDLGIDFRRDENGGISIGPDPRDRRREERRRDDRVPRYDPYDQPDYDPDAPQ